MNNNTIETYAFNSLVSGAGASYDIDFNVTGSGASDVISAAGGSGVVTLNSLNFMNGKTIADITDKDFRVQIVDNNGAGTIGLALGEALASQLDSAERMLLTRDSET